MKYNLEKKYIYQAISICLALCGAILFYYLLFHGFDLINGIGKLFRIMMPVIYGCIVTYMLVPVLNFFERRLIKFCERKKIKLDTPKRKKNLRCISVAITMIVFFACLIFVISMLFPKIIESINKLTEDLPIYVNHMKAWPAQIFKNSPEIANFLDQKINNNANKVEEFMTDDFAAVLNNIVAITVHIYKFFKELLNIIIGLIISIYLLVSKENFKGQFKKIIYALLDKNKAEIVLKEISHINETFGGFLNGKILDSIIIGVICFIVCAILKMPYALIISVIVGVTNIIPFFGPFLGAIPSAFLILLVDPKKCIVFLIFVVILQQIDGNIIGPWILGDSTGLSSFWVIFSITIFGGLFGIWGMFIGVPLFAVIYSFIRRLCKRLLEKKGLPTDTAEYINNKSISNITKETK